MKNERIKESVRATYKYCAVLKYRDFYRNLLITLKTIKRILYSFNNLHNPNYSMFKTMTHNAHIIMMINKESYIKEKES